VLKNNVDTRDMPTTAGSLASQPACAAEVGPAAILPFESPRAEYEPDNTVVEKQVVGFDAKDGPAGVTLSGRAFSEPRLIGLAYAFEQATHYRFPPKARRR